MPLNNKDKIVMEAFPAEPGDKHTGDFYRYEREDLSLMGTDRGGTISTISFNQNPYQRDQFDIAISFDKENTYAMERAVALLTNAGFNAETKAPRGGEAIRSIIVKNVGETDLMKSVIALAKDVPNGKSDTHYALLSRDEAAQVVAQELDRLKTTPLQAGLININRVPMSAERMRELGVVGAMGYIDIDLSGYPIGPVAYMREDAVPVGKFGTTRMEISTQLELQGIKPEVMQETLAQAGIKSKKVSDNQLSVSAGADSISRTLAEKGMIPAAIGVEASLVAKQMRPDYVAEETRGQAPAMKAKANTLG